MRDIATPTKTKEILMKHNLQMKKSLGQNFLVDTNITDKIIRSSDINNNTGVIEIGPGIGSLTQQLAKYAKTVMAYEIDQRLLPVLEDTLQDYSNVHILNQDILKADVSADIKLYLNDVEEVIVVANLPYYITTPIIMNLLEADLPVQRYVVMMQKEVGERLVADPGSKSYGSLSIAVQYYTDVSQVMIVPKNVFMPPPNVDSIVVKLEKKSDLPDVGPIKQCFKLVRGAFNQRRKTILNNYQSVFVDGKSHKESIKEWLLEADIDPKIRGEVLTLEQYSKLNKLLNNYPELVIK
ncbi:16S rRNA (adenine(1518)-N(6)/adenine(1519)-N(6))-dimethyltransferase RsmA [Abyssicoccus albus]|uniref:Ribosomal RNA small subunit methyltransferase A n=1 Tax=Abyssicoccus albus TaxID=1817405 RepID=A0A3N5C4X7_9BACL|nr:16S rRNA (adenine(1518)-N(6)/adenine(1519)-N(6))-dimethyltransferase RsmA [Abyssicoccus albus]RPF54482.1 16S rRNA (adenine1518-N6/adenine1519-N6)-dimethyltransferase [Abyssicoccus albus]